MHGWTGHETAIWVRRSVQDLQSALGALRKDGKYSADLHSKLRSVLVASGLRDQANVLDSRGPGDLTLFPASQVAWEDIALAWAWWVKLRGKAQAQTQAEEIISRYNENLAADGNAPLTAADAEEFVGDGAIVVSRKSVLMVLGGIALAAAAVGAGVSYGRRHCPATQAAARAQRSS